MAEADQRVLKDPPPRVFVDKYGEGAVTMTQTLTLSSEPSCTHTYYYTGEKNW